MQLGLFSVSYAGYWGQDALSLSEFIAKAARARFRYGDAGRQAAASLAARS